jgi:hypothetical protein
VVVSIGRAGYTVVSQKTAVSLAHEYNASTTPWQRFERGVARRTAFGLETIVVDQEKAEEFLTVVRRQGPKVWRWSVQARNLVPRLTRAGTVEFLAGTKPAGLFIPAVAIFNAAGKDITPAGLRWSLNRAGSSWRLQLRLDDSKLPLPYVIDPGITFQSKSENGNSNAAFLEINKPAGIVAGDFLIAQITVRGGTGTTITPPSGWTLVRRDDNGTTLAQAIYYKIVVTPGSEPMKYRWDFGPGANVQRASGGIIRYSGVDTANPIDNSSGNTGNGTSLTALSVTTTTPNDMLVGFFGLARSGGTLTEPTGMTFRYEVVSGGGGATTGQARSLAADEVQANPGPSGNRTAMASSNASGPWVAQLVALRPAGVPATLTLEPAAATNAAGQQHCVTATVKDSAGNPSVGYTVRFSVTGANSASGAATTNASGQAQFCYTGTNVGTDTISAFADTDNDGTQDAGEPSGTASKVYTPAAPAVLTLSPPVAQNPAATEHCVTATVTDTFGNPVPGTTVRFSVTGFNTATGSATTDANGQAEFCYTGTNVGVDAITAYADTNNNGVQDLLPPPGEPSGVAVKTYVPGAPASLTLEPAVDTNAAGEQHCVTATVRDIAGNPVPNISVVFSVSGANPRSAVAVTTNASGQATFCYTGTAVGPDAISAFADTNGSGTHDLLGEPAGTAAKIYTAAAPASLVLEPEEDTNRAGEEHCVTATVEDQFGNPTPGVVVRFSVSGPNSQPGVATTDANGEATFCYTGTKTGTDTITAFADSNANTTQDTGEPSDTATKTYTPGAPATVVVNPPADTNRAGEEHCVTATVTDAFANPTPGVAVAFSVTGANSASGSGTTDANGQAQFCYTGTTAGEDVITATADGDEDGTVEAGEPAGAATKLYRPGRPATVTVEPPTATNRAGEQHCVTATVRDEFGNPVEAGIAVSFTVTGANPQSTSVTSTDASGQATFCYTGTKAGEDVITATADGDEDGTVEAGEPTGTATKTYTPADPASLVLEPEQATNTAGEQHCVTATVKDRFGNPTPGIIVQFSVAGANSAAGAEATDANGQATFCYTGTKAGTDTITAFADTNASTTQDNGEPGDTATKVYEPGPPAKVVLEPATATNKAGEEHCVTATVTDTFDNPTPGIAVAFSVSGANSASGSGTTDADGEATFCYTGTVAGLDTITATADGDEDGIVETGEPTGTATKVYTPAEPATVTLTPKTAVNPVDSEHCVTATVRDRFGNPTPQVTVFFDVSGSVNTSGSAKTNKDGEATFCYDGPPLPGEDLITAVADANDNGTADPGEPSDTATKTWVLPVSTPGCEVKITYGGWFHTLLNGDKASFGGNAAVSTTGEVKGEEEYQDHGPETPMNVHSINVLAVVCTPTNLEASIYGQATIDGAGSFFYRIQVTDNGEPGTSDIYGILLSNGYFSGDQTLEGGNVQIHSVS